jgi:uncharacterized protein (TIGR04551 family)
MFRLEELPMTRTRGPAIALALIPALLISLDARAQAPGMPPTTPGGEEETKTEGVAEKAPKEPGQLPTVPVLPPWPGQKRKQFQLFELDGYYRVRMDWFKNFAMGFGDAGRGTPFPRALTCQTAASMDVEGNCSGTLSWLDMRLRLEPVVNLSEQVSVHAQIDVLDNMILGGTTEGVYLANRAEPPPDAPATPFSMGQAPQDGGRNFAYDSIRVKRAWGEVMTPLGLLQFGRMPSHWGMGMVENAGSTDPFHGTVCLDCDYGDTVDRLYFSAKIPGTNLRAAAARDFAAAGWTSAQTDTWNNRTNGQPWDLENTDDMTQWVLVLSHLDSPEVWKEQLEQGEMALNYGIYASRRKLQNDIDLTPDPTTGDQPPEATIVKRDATIWVPDAYLRFGWGKLNVEAEAVLMYGSIGHLEDVSPPLSGEQTILGYGGTARLNVLLADDDLDLGLEVGFASGDQWEGDRDGLTNAHDKPFLPIEGEIVQGDDTISNFFFDYDYHVDLILFREILGTVTNAAYFKPALAYNLTDRLTFKTQVVLSFPHVSVSTPGNGQMYGIELDGDLGYHNDDEGFFAGLSYGVLFPFGALDHPSTGGLWTDGAVDEGDADTVQTIQGRLVLKF